MIFVRAAESHDRNAILEILSASFAPFKDEYPEGSWMKTILDQELLGTRMSEYTVLVAENGGRPVGTIAWQERHPGVGYIRGMAVHPRYQGSLAGRSLLQAVERDAARHGCTSMTLHITEPLKRARRFYERAGYEVIGGQHDWEGMPVVKMRKSL